MLQFAISMTFGLTVGVIMCLILWLNTKFTLTEFVTIIGFVFLSSTVWTFTKGRFTHITLLALLVVWTLARILVDKWRAFEKILRLGYNQSVKNERKRRFPQSPDKTGAARRDAAAHGDAAAICRYRNGRAFGRGRYCVGQHKHNRQLAGSFHPVWADGRSALHAFSGLRTRGQR